MIHSLKIYNVIGQGTSVRSKDVNQFTKNKWAIWTQSGPKYATLYLMISFKDLFKML